jgi:hypothetical protein
MSCSLCQQVKGHKPTCPHADSKWTVDWSTVSIWQALTIEIFREWSNDSIHENEQLTKDMFKLMSQSLADGDAYTALELIKEYRDIVKTDGRA